MNHCIRPIVFTLSLFVSLAFTNNDHDPHENHSHHNMSTHQASHAESHHHVAPISLEMQKYANEVYNLYLALSKNLARDDFHKAKDQAIQLASMVEKIPEHQTTDKYHQKMTHLIHAMAQAKNMDELRQKFSTFSEEYIDHMKPNAKVLDKEFRVFYCPMKKARWVQDQSGTQNPYYGSKMLTCGSEQK